MKQADYIATTGTGSHVEVAEVTELPKVSALNHLSPLILHL